MNSQEFQVVKRKNRKKAGRNALNTHHAVEREIETDDTFDNVAFEKRLNACMQELRLSEFFQHCNELIQCALSSSKCSTSLCFEEETKEEAQNQSVVRDSSPSLLSYGIGRFSSCPIARFQLAFLLVLREKLKNPECLVYDPLFSTQEQCMLTSLGCTLIPNNEEGKRLCHFPTVVFMPHCGKALYNNFIWANLATLGNVLIIGNSFSRMIESTPHRILKQTANYVIKTSHYVMETPLKSSSFIPSDIFNDLSLHVYPRSQLDAIPNTFWEGNTEPDYNHDDAEFIRKENIDDNEGL